MFRLKHPIDFNHLTYCTKLTIQAVQSWFILTTKSLGWSLCFFYIHKPSTNSICSPIRNGRICCNAGCWLSIRNLKSKKNKSKQYFLSTKFGGIHKLCSQDKVGTQVVWSPWLLWTSVLLFSLVRIFKYPAFAIFTTVVKKFLHSCRSGSCRFFSD